MEQEKDILWVGSSYEDLLAFPVGVRKQAGFQLGKIQVGLESDDWKPFGEVGAGVQEIRLRDRSGAYRIMYIAKFDEVVYVLHCFQKKTQATSSRDKEIAKRRYQSIVSIRSRK